MNKLLTIVTLSICIVIASASHLDARTENPPRSRNHYPIHQQHHQSHHHNRKLQSAAPTGAHSRKNTTTTLTATSLSNGNSGNSSRTIDGGGGSTGGRPLRLRQLSYDDKQQQSHVHRRTFHRTGRNFENRRGSGGASPSPSYPEWQSRFNHNNNNVRTYNINNGHGYAVSVGSSSAGKDEIMRDVEHINGDDLSNDWNPRVEPELVTLPPSTTTLMTTTTTTTSTTTEGPFGTGYNGRKNAFDGRMDSKTLESRHICMQQRTLQVPVKSVEVYSRPIWKHMSHPCPPQTNQSNQMCTRVQLVHEPAYRDVIRHKTTKQIVYDCCPGWGRMTKMSNACMKPVCSVTCRNGGTCMGPDKCSCLPGYGGKYCERDINECKEEKPCDQLCFNTEGSFYCQCREGFMLQSDKQSCRKIDNHDDDAFEARDLENEIDNNEVTSRLHKIEKSLANERITTNELQKSLDATYHVVDSLKNRLSTLEKQQQDVNHLQGTLIATETRTRKLENMISILFKCRNNPGPYCP